jgi:sugar phosphate isomerase/epimerase
MQNRKLLITDWGNVDKALPFATRYQVGLEVQEFTTPANLDAPQELIEGLKEKTKDLSMVSMHGPFSDLIPASRDPLIRHVVRERFIQACQVAEQIGAKHLILHSGYIPKTYPSDMWLRNSLDFWIDLLNHDPFEGEIHVENVYDDDFSSLKELIDRVNQVFQTKRLTICLDIGHVNANSSRPFTEWVPGLGDRIGYTHLHNNGGSLDDHWQLDQGTIQIEQVLDLLVQHAPEATWTVETPFDGIEPSLLWLQARGYLA